jgi:leucyl-tRNA synthetase
LKYRIAYLRESTVNWCAALGTVLANDEVINGVSERGGYPVEQKKMMQWSMRITAYADRLLKGLDTIDWPEPLVEMQRNWIGKSVGASVKFPVPQLNTAIEVFTTRVDTIYGVSFVVLAPEHELVAALTTPEQQTEVDAYIEKLRKNLNWIVWPIQKQSLVLLLVLTLNIQFLDRMYRFGSQIMYLLVMVQVL